MILGLNLAIDDTLNLPGASCCGAVSTPRLGFPWTGLAMEGFSIIYIYIYIYKQSKGGRLTLIKKHPI